MVLLVIGGWATGRILYIEHYKAELVTTSDARGYYAYLPAAFIHGDILFRDFDSFPKETQEKYWVKETELGAHIPKVTMGVAIAMLPGFLSGHIAAMLFDYELNGWTAPYQLGIALNAVLILLLGCWMLYHWLARRFPPWSASLTVLLLFFATNLLYYGIDLNAMSHVYTFTLFSGVLFLSDRWLSEHKPWQFAVLGMLIGWMVLIRPINVLFAIVLLGCIWHRVAQNRARWSDFLNGKLFAAMAGGFIMVLPQLLYWKAATGDWLHYSYNQETFYFGNAHVLEGCFSFRNGWLIYTPVMWLVPLGLLVLWRTHRYWVWVTLMVLPVYLYVVFSWWCWYYGDSFSIRAMIDIYPMLALPMAALLHWVFKQRIWWKLIGAAAVLFLLVNNIWMVNQYHHGLINGSMMTGEAFKAVWWNSDPPMHLDLTGAYKIGDNDRLRLGMPERTQRDTIVEREVAIMDFEQPPHEGQEQGWQGKGRLINEHDPYSPALSASATEFETPYDRILNISCYVRADDFKKSDGSLVISFKNGDDSYLYRTIDFAKMDLKPGQWNRVDAYLREPQDLPQTGLLETYGWAKGTGDLLIDHLEIRQLDCPWRENE